MQQLNFNTPGGAIIPNKNFSAHFPNLLITL